MSKEIIWSREVLLLGITEIAYNEETLSGGK